MKKNAIFRLGFIILLFVFSLKVKALTYGGCEYADISRLKSLVSNVNISYDYFIKDNLAYFNITISNIAPEFYFIDSSTNLKYDYSNAVDGEITLYNIQKSTGSYKFYSALGECYGVKISNIYYNLPTYNNYYTDPLCQNNKNFSLCQKWTKVNYSYSEFAKKINDYNNKEEQVQDEPKVETIHKETFLDVLIKFYIEYYYFILIGIILICVVLMVINKKKNSFDL